MYGLERLSKVFKTADEIILNNRSKLVLMSDCHRGDGTWGDNFAKNQAYYFTALSHYYNNKFIYIELGDGDELWEVKKFSDIFHMHKDVFWLLSKFHQEGRFYSLFGNHDMVKGNKKFIEKNLYSYYDGRVKKHIPLFKDIKIHEGLVLKYQETNNKIFLVHGHQVDFFNYTLWPLARFLVLNLWRPFESHGIKNRASPAINYEKKEDIDRRLIDWTIKNNLILIAGHTHRPMFPHINEPAYFNTGSCVHPRCITAIEIEGNSITLVKWGVKARENGDLFIGRDIIVGPEQLSMYFEDYKEKEGLMY